MGAGCLSLSRGTQRPDMRTTGTRVTHSSCRAWMPFNAPLEGISSPATKGKKKTREQDTTRFSGPFPSQSSPEGCRDAPLPPPRARPGSPARSPLIFCKPSWASAPPGLVLQQTHRAGRCCRLSGCKGLPYLQPPLTASHWFMLLRGQFASPGERGAVSGGAWEWGWWGPRSLPCKVTARASPGSAAVWAPWEPGVGVGAEAPEGREDPGQQLHREEQSQGGDGRGPSGRGISGVPFLLPLPSSGSLDTPASHQPTPHCPACEGWGMVGQVLGLEAGVTPLLGASIVLPASVSSPPQWA